ncbi:histone acetylation protein-domain-containing protein [Emericellopsis atlantica]|uniref:histone acetyltransferase n=1 Tax=Emericellopsis atlantica TaxID=2614577 RepID=A0A9P7ZHV3_9HYPO|nr:histone acetylation protein-domain-containing protein [Emericellopsis atlantica]KAG9252206.1 histone acetylation protein-domain-containing protein [Emericellopsis atlantica]
MSDTLGTRLAKVLPKSTTFHVHHLSTPPTKCEPLCSPPPNERPDRTYCEKHFLCVSIDRPVGTGEVKNKQVLILGVEVFIFTTARATTIFVSKADSTGYLHILNLPKGTPSPIREVCATFVNFLVDTRRRKDVQLVISLFARAQDQYLFPGSVKNKGKHVLDDRGLVKWWCRVLDPILGHRIGGYLVVPGHDAHETKAFLPKGSTRWTTDHPLEKISHYTKEFDWVPPRCLIPKYPDDPKSRFRDELDDEATRTKSFRLTGNWKSVKTLDTFWEMMAFRQECSSGRLTGFVWIVFDDEAQDDTKKNSVLPTPNVSSTEQPQAPETPKKSRTLSNVAVNTTPRKLFTSKTMAGAVPASATKKTSKKQKKKKKKLTGIVIARAPRIKTAAKNYEPKAPSHTAHYAWNEEGRGERIVREADYKRMVELLLHLDFSTLDKAAASTSRWTGEVGMGASFGYGVVGTREIPTGTNDANPSDPSTNDLNGLVKRKRAESGAGSEVNTLGAGVIRKKPKPEETAAPAVNTLSAGLVRKKPKKD